MSHANSTQTPQPSGPLAGLTIFDLTRVLAGPTCVQMLADLGASVIKIEKPGSGDDTRGFVPPAMPGTDQSAYFAGANRNKRSVTIDIAKPAGQKLAHDLIAQCDILVENFKVGTLARYGLGYEQLGKLHPGLIYCSITGFGQTGPYAERPGYDSLIQGMGGVMSLTGEPDGQPMKVGVPVADLFAGLYGAIGVLAALRHREATGLGQQVDIGMLDTNVAWLANQGMNYLASGQNPPRLGNQHPNIVPYQVFATADGDQRGAGRQSRVCDRNLGQCAGGPRFGLVARRTGGDQSRLRPDQHARTGVRRPARHCARQSDRDRREGRQSCEIGRKSGPFIRNTGGLSVTAPHVG
jgi:crotonobetainyl-CoA:carnitine CoA-transferase CaiB-like acyl-CoA transferase